MFWALASRLIKVWGGKLITIEVGGTEYLALALPLNRWRRNVKGEWMPTDLISADAELPTDSVGKNKPSAKAE